MSPPGSCGSCPCLRDDVWVGSLGGTFSRAAFQPVWAEMGEDLAKDPVRGGCLRFPSL